MAMHTAMTAASLPPLNTGSLSDCCAGNVDDAVGGRCGVDNSGVGGSECQVDWVVRLDKGLEDISLAPLNDERLVYPERESGGNEPDVAGLLVVSVSVSVSGNATEITGAVWGGATVFAAIDGESWW